MTTDNYSSNKTTLFLPLSSASFRSSQLVILHDRELREVPPKLQLRAEDEREVMISGGNAQEAIAFGIEHSFRTRAIYAGEILVAVWGYKPTSVIGGGCIAWMLSTPEIEKHKVAAARASQEVLDSLLICHPWVIVTVDARYATAIRWLKWLGFKTICQREVNTLKVYDMRRDR